MTSGHIGSPRQRWRRCPKSIEGARTADERGPVVGTTITPRASQRDRHARQVVQRVPALAVAAGRCPATIAPT